MHVLTWIHTGFILLCPPSKCVCSVGDSRFIRGCELVRQGGCALYTHTASVTLVISFCKTVTAVCFTVVSGLETLSEQRECARHAGAFRLCQMLGGSVAAAK